MNRLNRCFPVRESEPGTPDERWVARVQASLPHKPTEPERALEIHGDTHWHVEHIHVIAAQPRLSGLMSFLSLVFLVLMLIRLLLG